MMLSNTSPNNKALICSPNTKDFKNEGKLLRGCCCSVVVGDPGCVMYAHYKKQTTKHWSNNQSILKKWLVSASPHSFGKNMLNANYKQ